jgi:8-oxo-dGTP pyrophosphatase MutT (NUDIX family)
MTKNYWKLKAIELEGQVLRQQLQAAWSRQEAKRRAAYEEAGLDASVVYRLDDATETFTPDESTTQEASHDERA